VARIRLDHFRWCSARLEPTYQGRNALSGERGETGERSSADFLEAVKARVRGGLPFIAEDLGKVITLDVAALARTATVTPPPPETRFGSSVRALRVIQVTRTYRNN